MAETDDGGASTVTIDPDEPISVDADQTATVTVTNSFDPAVIRVDKRVDGDAAAFAPDTFPIAVTCSADGAVLPGFPVMVEVTPGTPAEIDTLSGADCSAIETDTGQATEVTYDPPAADGDGSGPVVATDDPDAPATITVTNTYGAGALQVLKRIDGTGASSATGPFVFGVVCAFNDDDEAYTDTVTLRKTGTSLVLRSELIAPLPVGAVCTVSETDDGGADQTPPPVTVTIQSAAVEQAAVAQFVNTFTAAEDLPVTGGPGIAWGALAAAAVMIGIGILLAVRRRRHTE
ncbi:DUF5979 domain-containing protein [Microbacterium elymi]|uniref:DUF5979 domain-containing protein n=1 Tax=Microbacterium elymi TaxID=2909587 RepID=UPI00338D555E